LWFKVSVIVTLVLVLV